MKKEEEFLENENSKKEAIILVALFIIILGVLIASIELFNKQSEKDVKKNKEKEEEVIKIKKDNNVVLPVKSELVTYNYPVQSRPIDNVVNEPALEENTETNIISSSKLLGISIIDDTIKVNGTARYEVVDGNVLNSVDIRFNLKDDFDINNLSIKFITVDDYIDVDPEVVVKEENGKYYFDYTTTIKEADVRPDVIINYGDTEEVYFIDSSEVKPLKEVKDIDVLNSLVKPSETEAENNIIGNQELTYDFTILEEDKTAAVIADDEVTEEDLKNYILKFEGTINYYENGEMDRVGLGDYNNIVVVKVYAPISISKDDFKDIVMEISRPNGEVLTIKGFDENDFDGLDSSNNRYYKYIYHTVESENAPWFSVDWDGDKEVYEEETYTYDTTDTKLEVKPEEEIIPDNEGTELVEEEEVVEA